MAHSTNLERRNFHPKAHCKAAKNFMLSWFFIVSTFWPIDVLQECEKIVSKLLKI